MRIAHAELGVEEVVFKTSLSSSSSSAHSILALLPATCGGSAPSTLVIKSGHRSVTGTFTDVKEEYSIIREELGHGRLPGPSMSHVVGEWRRRWIAWRRLEVVGCETRSVQGEEEEVPQASHAPSPS